MKFRGLVIAVVVLCALGGVLYWSGHHKHSGESTALAANQSPVILNTNTSAVTGLTIKKKGAAPITLDKTDSGSWKITAPDQYNADQETISGMLSALSPLDAERVIDDNGSSLQSYGLDQPSLELDVTGKGGKTQQLDFGDQTPTGDSVYVMLAGNPRVFTAANFNKTSLDKDVNDLRDKRLLPVDADNITRLELLAGHQDIVFSHTNGKWKIEKPSPLRTDNFSVDDLADQLTDARMDLTGSASSDAEKAFPHAAPVATAKLTDNSGTQVFELRKSGDNYYAESSAVKGEYQVDSSLGDALNKSLDDFRNKTIFDFSYNQPNKIELHEATKAWFLTRSGTDWWSDGKKMDEESVDSLVSELRGLTASKFVESGFTNPDITVTVTSQNGQKVEEVQIAESGADYIAKRQNEPSLYFLNASDVKNLLDAASGIKPASAKS
jgi:hypothetical protein